MMAVLRRLTALIWLLTFVVVCVSCGNGKSPTQSDDLDDHSADSTGIPDGTLYTTLNWVGADILYDTAITKHDHSMLFILATWCGWCRKLKRETLQDSSVIQILGESFNIVQIDPDSDSLVVHGDSAITCRQMAHDVYRVKGYPTMIVLDRTGAETGRITGYLPPDRFAARLNAIRTGR